MQRPLVIISLSKISEIKANQEYLIEALEHILVMIREKMLLPYHVEKWNLMLDTDDVMAMKNIEGFLQALYDMVRDNFPQSLYKVYLRNVNLMSEINENWNRKRIIFSCYN